MSISLGLGEWGMGPYKFDGLLGHITVLINVGSPESEGPGNNFTHVTLDDPFAALLDNELSLSLSPAKLSHPENGFT